MTESILLIALKILCGFDMCLDDKITYVSESFIPSHVGNDGWLVMKYDTTTHNENMLCITPNT